MKRVHFIWWAALFGTIASAEISGEAVYERTCKECHTRFVDFDLLAKNFMEHNNTLLKLKGPTVNQLAFRLKQRVGDPDGDPEFHLMEVVEFVKEYVITPDRGKSVCMDEVMGSFEMMPSLEGKVSEEELEAVAEWIYNSDIEKDAP